MHAPLEKAAAPAAIKRRTITLTNRAPVSIVDDDWEIISEGKYEWEHPGGGDIRSYGVAFRVRREKLKIAYGIRHSQSHIIHARYFFHDDDDGSFTVRVGRILSEDRALRNLWKEMVEVAEELRERIDNKNMHKHVTVALDQCFANLEPHKA